MAVQRPGPWCRPAWPYPWPRPPRPTGRQTRSAPRQSQKYSFYVSPCCSTTAQKAQRNVKEASEYRFHHILKSDYRTNCVTNSVTTVGTPRSSRNGSTLPHARPRAAARAARATRPGHHPMAAVAGVHPQPRHPGLANQGSLVGSDGVLPRLDRPGRAPARARRPPKTAPPSQRGGAGGIQQPDRKRRVGRHLLQRIAGRLVGVRP